MRSYTYEHFENDLEERQRKAQEQRLVQEAIEREKNRRKRKRKQK